MSIYDNIITAKDLVSEVMHNGFSTAQEDINRAQDILGRSSIADIAFLADGGKKNCYGDAKSSRIQSTFFNIIFACWDRDRAVALYNQHITRYPELLEAAREKLQQETREHAVTRGLLQERSEALTEAIDERQAAERDRDEANELYDQMRGELNVAELEILHLKARLYDQMTAGA